MKWIKFILAFIVTGAWIYFLNRPIVTSKSTIPALGNFLNPASGFWKNGALEDVHFGKIKSEHLLADAVITWDKRLVPHIEAKSIEDLFYLQGYSVASQRLWQMDMLARSAIGRLAEVLGDKLVSRDIVQRRMGMLFAAENAVEGWKQDPANYKYLLAYTQGVNDWINQLSTDNFPIEYKLMGFTPEPWTTLKSAAVVKYMAQSLCSRENDLEASNTLKLLGDSLYQFLYPTTFADQSPIIPSVPHEWDYIGETKKDTSTSFFENQSALYKRSTPLPDEGLGSNNWAVAGSKTKSGHPILCNDPHLRLTLPSIWFENHLHSDAFNAYGVSVPGIPGILIGFNDSIAWGETNVAQDVADWYTIKWSDDKKDSYQIDEQIYPVSYRFEKIYIKGRKFIIDTVKYTSWGPIVYDTASNEHVGLAYHWIAHEKPENFEMSVFVNLMKARNYNDYYKALETYSSPAQNFIFASRSGDIALTVNGKFPLKNKEQGKFVQDGSSSKNAWHGFIPYAHNPRVKNPARGFVSSANQNSTDETYPYYYNGDFDSFRGRTINLELEKSANMVPEDMMAMQNSTFNLKAYDNLPAMLGGIDPTQLNANQQQIYSALQNWNLRFEATSQEALAFNLWYNLFYKMIFDEIYTSASPENVQYPKTFMTSELLKSFPTNKIFDIKSTVAVETSKEVLLLSFLQTVDSLSKLPADQKTWSAYVKPKIQHMANLPGFSRENLLVGGAPECLNAIKNGAGPSWRMIVDLGDTLKSYVVYPGGQSGNPGSKYYDNMIDDWVKGNYYRALFDKPSYTTAQLGIQNFVKK
ncbi:MAG: penicillin acylase family protein [Saprospiraceae bacterium]